MPWCPNCKNEYKAGITICTDCNVALTDQLVPAADYIFIAGLEEEKYADILIKFLSSEKIEAKKDYSEIEKVFLLSVRPKDVRKAKKLYQAFYSVELESMILDKLKEEKANGKPDEDLEEYRAVSEYSMDDETFEETDEPVMDYEEKTIINNMEAIDKETIEFDSEEHLQTDVLNEEKSEEESEEMQSPEEQFYRLRNSASVYVKKSVKSKELRSTASTFIAFGILGFIFTILNLLKVFTLFDNTLSFVVMCIMFAGCLVIGFVSLKDSKKAEKEAVEEEALTEAIHLWLKNNFTKKTAESFKNVELSDEMNYFAVIDGMRKAITDQFGEMDDSYLDSVIEEYYNKEMDI